MTKQLRERLQCSGAQDLSNEELLTVVLTVYPARNDVREQISKLLLDFGGLGGLLRAEFGQLCQEYRLGPAKAAQLQAVGELAKRLAAQPTGKKYQIRCPEDAARLLMPEMCQLDYEQVRVLVLDTKNQVSANVVLYQGTLNSSVIRAAEIFRAAVARKGAGIILCHNHPSGQACEASPEDIELTEQLVEAGKLLDIPLIDHLIIGAQCFLSLKEQLKWT